MPKPIASMPSHQARAIKWLLTDVDDTLTWQGSLPAETIIALEKLQAVGINVVPVTGSCAGWVNQIAKIWPVHGAIGENGAFWMRKTSDSFITHSEIPMQKMRAQQAKIVAQLNLLLKDYPDISFANDQDFRLCDVAINLSQDREPVNEMVASELLSKIEQLSIEGEFLNATASSIHINVWLGEHSKRSASETYLLAHNERQIVNLDEVAYVGDSLNDEAMFEWLPVTFGVRNIESLLPKLNAKPTYITEANGGYGFAELADIILCARQDLNFNT